MQKGLSRHLKTLPLLFLLPTTALAGTGDTGWFAIAGGGGAYVEGARLSSASLTGITVTLDTERGSGGLWRLGFGYRANQYVGVAFDYFRAADIASTRVSGAASVKQTSETDGLIVQGVYFYDFNHWLTAYAKVGVGGARINNSYTYNSQNFLLAGEVGDETGLGPAGGLGVQVDLHEGLSFVLDFQAVAADQEVYFTTGNLQYNF